MKKIASCVLMALGLSVSTLAHAGEAGLGVTLKANEGAVLIPFRVGRNLMLEGKLDYARSSFQNRSGGATLEQSGSSGSAGLGVFWLRPLTESSRLYLGPRAALVRNTGTFSVSGQTEDYGNTGWNLTPTVGFEYFPVKNVSLGGEVGYAYTRVHGTQTSSGVPATFDTASTGNFSGTVSSVVLRVYF